MPPIIRLNPLLQASIEVVLQGTSLRPHHSIAHPGRLPPIATHSNGTTERVGKKPKPERMVFLFPLYGFLFCTRLPECIATEGDASFARAGSPVETVLVSSLVQNRNKAVMRGVLSFGSFCKHHPWRLPCGSAEAALIRSRRISLWTSKENDLVAFLLKQDKKYKLNRPRNKAQVELGLRCANLGYDI